MIRGSAICSENVRSADPGPPIRGFFSLTPEILDCARSTTSIAARLRARAREKLNGLFSGARGGSATVCPSLCVQDSEIKKESPRMPSKPPTFRPSHSPSRKQLNTEYEARRRTAKPWRKWYYTARWYALRDAQLRLQPLCQHCREQEPSTIAAAYIVHHIVAHKGDATLFFDQRNVASVCKPCHDGPIHALEIRGEVWVPRGGT